MTFLRTLPDLARRHKVVGVLLVLITLLGGYQRFDAIGTSTRVSVDERSYLGIANNMLVHRSYAYGKDPLHWAPGTPFMFWASMKATGTGPYDQREAGQSNPPLYAQAIVGTLAILAVFAFAAWLGGPIAGLVAAFFTAVYDPLNLVARSFLAEPLGGLGLVLTLLLLSVAVSRRDRSRWLCLGTGVVLGFTLLSRNDMLPLIGILPLLAGIMIWRAEDLRKGLTVAALVVAGGVVTILPWVTYATIENRKFTPITTAGPSSLWVATYLPAGGRQIIAKRQFMDEVCRTFPDRQDACGVTATQMDMRLIWELFERRHPGKTQEEAIQAELDRNIREYALGEPVEYSQMLVNKAGRIWVKPWGGGAIGRMESSIWQHRIFLGTALIGIIVGLIWGGRRRRYILLAVAALFTVTALNTIFVSESRMSLRMTPLLLATGIGGLGAAYRAKTGDDEPEAEADDAAAGDDPDELHDDASAAGDDLANDADGDSHITPETGPVSLDKPDDHHSDSKPGDV